MMFKGHSLRLSCLGLMAALLIVAGSQRLHAQTAQGSAYRILVLDKLAPERLEDAKRWLEGMRLPSQFFIDQDGGLYRITFGSYPSSAAAEAARGELLDKEGIRSISVVEVKNPAPTGIVEVKAPAGTGNELLTIYVRDFKDRAQADALKQKLEPNYRTVYIRQVGAFYEVYVGQYDARAAALALGQLKKDGYQTAQVRPVPPATQPVPNVVVAQDLPAPGGDIDQKALPIQSEVWNKLSPDEKRKLINNAELQAQIRKGDPLANQMFDIKKRMENLESNLKQVVDDLDKNQKALEDRRNAINEATDAAENLIKSEKYKEARLKLQEALELDKENVFGQRTVTMLKIQAVDSKLKGDDYPGQSSVNAKRIARLQNEIKLLQNSNDVASLRLAITKHSEIMDLDANYKSNAESQIAQLNRAISGIQESERLAAEKKDKQNQQFFMGLAGGFGVLLIMVLLVWARTRKRHMELMRKVQEITSIRPMRELEGTGPQLLGGTESDIFSPMNPAGGGDAIDPLGGVLTPPPPPDKKAKGKKGKGAKEPEPAPVAAASDGLDDIFGSGDMGGGSSGLDDIFGSPAPAASKPAAVAAAAEPTMKAAEAPTAASSTSDIDDIFGGLFSDESSPGTAQAPAAQPAKKEEESSPAQSTGPISFGDFITASAEHGETQASAPDSDLLTVFDSPSPAKSGKSNGQEVDPLQDNPFASMFSEEPAGGDTGTKEDDSEIPSIRLDATSGGSTTANSSPFGGFELSGSLNPGATTPAAESLDLPAFSFDDLVGATSINVVSGNPGTELDFEQDAAGQTPRGWEGNYPFARLTVEADTPPRGAQQYLCFQKAEGAGKAHYSYRFGNVSGVVCIEFDMRCNDKNKFLLGFYIEKDGDFQQSVHTKILRSEAQTSPTIHMQGQSAPYLLGSWAHIKYVVDLNEGRVNGYIDSTHVVRDLALTPNPGMLNTLSIRDNINTTGVLLLDNIKVYEIQ